jgi:hypothetical protein
MRSGPTDPGAAEEVSAGEIERLRESAQAAQGEVGA